jgi:hypothetical protein
VGYVHSNQQSSVGRRVALTIGGLVALALAGYVGSVVGPHFKAGSAATTSTTRPLSTTTSTLAHASVKVLVANGTQQPNTAAHFSQQLQLQGWSVVTPKNATTSSAATTTIYYGPYWQQSAMVIASELGAPATAVQPMSAAVPVASTAGLDVVVVIGSDLAGTGFPATTVPVTTAPTG